MLIQLRVRNLAIIESVDIEFGAGLNALTGETGAGKSILLAALGLVLGGRSDRGLVRTGQKEAWVEAMFDNQPHVLPLLEEWGIQGDLEEPVVLRRVVTDQGRSKAYINSTSVPASHLQVIAPYLVDFGKQHEQATLSNPENHILLLDTFAMAEKERENVSEAYQEVLSLIRKKEKLLNSQSERKQRIEFLEFQKKQIKKVDPQPNELESLTQDLKRLQNLEECLQTSEKLEELLLRGEPSIQDLLGEVLGELDTLVKMDSSLGEIFQSLETAMTSVQDAGRTLRTYQRSLKNDPEIMAETESRLNEIIDLQERYGGDFDNLMNRFKDIEEELIQLNNQESFIRQLTQEIEEAKKMLAEKTEPLTEKRKLAAIEICKGIEKELMELAMVETQFFVQMDPVLEGGLLISLKGKQVRMQEHGIEKVAFYISANKGEELQPIEKVASGGELSRILLALKRVLSKSSSIQTFVFDEIDSGIGGEAVGKVARKLRQIASQVEGVSQILCITHTAQIAAEADYHFHVSKLTCEERTKSSVKKLTESERINELARMLAGSQTDDKAVALAKKLLKTKAA